MTDGSALPGPYGPIVFATDGSTHARGAAAAAAHLSRVLVAELQVVHCWTTPASAYSYSDLVTPGMDTSYEPAAREVLDNAIKGLRQRGAPISGAELCRGRTVDCVPDLAERLHARLIVAGSRGLGAVKRLFLGSVSEGLANASSVPVLIVPSRRSWPPTRIVVGEDGSAQSRNAALLAAQVASATSGQLFLVHVQPADWRHVETPQAAEELRTAKHAAKARLRVLAAEIQGAYSVRVKVRVEAGLPERVLARLAKRAGDRSLIAVGSRGRGAMARLALGSVSNRLLRTAPGSILICHGYSGGDLDRGLRPKALM